MPQLMLPCRLYTSSSHLAIYPHLHRLHNGSSCHCSLAHLKADFTLLCAPSWLRACCNSPSLSEREHCKQSGMRSLGKPAWTSCKVHRRKAPHIAILGACFNDLLAAKASCGRECSQPALPGFTSFSKYKH